MKKLLILLIVCCTLTAYGQQENQYTQFMYNQLVLNPAYAGARGHTSFQALYRGQWLGFEKAPTSKLLSFNTPLFGDRVGLGITIANHTHGIHNIWNGSMAYAYNVKINKETSFRFGIQGNIRNFNIDFSDPSVRVQQTNDPSVTMDDAQNKYTGNFGAGIYLSHKQMYFGVSVPSIYPNEIGINPTTRETAEEVPHLYLMAGTLIPVSSTVDIKPAVLLKRVENAPLDLDVNLSFVFNKKITAGISYRLGGDGAGESVDALVMFQYNSIAFGVAYDLGLSQLSDYNNGSFEALIRYDFLKERDDIANPRFFFQTFKAHLKDPNSQL